MQLNRTVFESILDELCKLNETTKDILEFLTLERRERIEANAASRKVIFPLAAYESQSCVCSPPPQSCPEATCQEHGKQEE